LNKNPFFAKQVQISLLGSAKLNFLNENFVEISLLDTFSSILLRQRALSSPGRGISARFAKLLRPFQKKSGVAEILLPDQPPHTATDFPVMWGGC